MRPDNSTQDNILAVGLKQQQFNSAIARYHSRSTYRWIGKAISFFVIVLQILMATQIFPFSISPLQQIAAFISAILIADFINGLVHMFMDNHDDYASVFGPLVAAFHLHHRTPQYAVRPLPVVYFMETGSKIWLIPFLGIGVLLSYFNLLPAAVMWGWFYTGVLSSVAEVAHYSCHVPETPIPKLLRFARLFISKKHHAKHHIKDNCHYAFLNGFTDPLLNTIARWFFAGYKETTDQHYAFYNGPDTKNRKVVA